MCMKKIFTLLAAALLAVSANAQETNYGFVVDAYPWHYSTTAKSTTLVNGDVTVTYNSQWGEYNLSYKPIDVSVYKGLKLTYSDYSKGTVMDDGNVGLQFKIESTDNADLNTYQPLPDDVSSTVTVDFKGTTGTLTTFSLQAKCKDPKITINSVKLIKNDDSEENWFYGGSVWGNSATGGSNSYEPAAMPCEVTYSGQYGGMKLANATTKSTTIWKVGDKPLTFTVKFTEAIPNTLVVEADNQNNGFQWFNIDKGATDFTFTLSDETCTKDVTELYIKANLEEADGVYPYTVKYASISSQEATTGINSIKSTTKAVGANAPIYNLAGQRVSKAYKGVVIQNGKKFLNK